MKTDKACPTPPENLLARCMNTIPADAVFPETPQTPGCPRLRLEPPSRKRLHWLTLAAAIPTLSLLIILPIHHYLASRADGAATSPESVTVSLKFTPIHDEDKYLQNPGHKCRLQVILREEGGRVNTVSNGPNVFCGDSADARHQVTADHRTVGWLWGHSVKTTSDTTHPNAKNYAFLPQQLCVYRWETYTRVIRGERDFIEAFHFWNNGKQVVFRTRGLHGVSDVVLYDIESGKEVAKLPGYKVNAASPAWAQGLGD